MIAPLMFHLSHTSLMGSGITFTIVALERVEEKKKLLPFFLVSLSWIHLRNLGVLEMVSQIYLKILGFVECFWEAIDALFFFFLPEAHSGERRLSDSGLDVCVCVFFLFFFFLRINHYFAFSSIILVNCLLKKIVGIHTVKIPFLTLVFNQSMRRLFIF